MCPARRNLPRRARVPASRCRAEPAARRAATWPTVRWPAAPWRRKHRVHRTARRRNRPTTGRAAKPSGRPATQHRHGRSVAAKAVQVRGGVLAPALGGRRAEGMAIKLGFGGDRGVVGLPMIGALSVALPPLGDEPRKIPLLPANAGKAQSGSKEFTHLGLDGRSTLRRQDWGAHRHAATAPRFCQLAASTAATS